jgi:hypothetical protein
MTTTITVLHENVDDATFDLDDCMANLMPLVDEKFKPFGLTSWRVLRAWKHHLATSRPNSIVANLEFDSIDQFRAAVAAEAGPVSATFPTSATRTLSS